MKKVSTPSAILLVAIVLAGAGANAQPGPGEPPRKKLLEYGWDVPHPDQIVEKIRAMERHPFDGILFRLREYNHVFDQRRWRPEDLEPQFELLRRIAWDKFTDNFLMLYVGRYDGQMDWFDDDQWSTFLANLELTAQAATLARAKGICFDLESWTKHKPWRYSADDAEHTFGAVADQVRRRGRQFIAVLQKQNPRIRLMSFFMLSTFGRVLGQHDPALRQAGFDESREMLVPAFLNGMLDAAGPEVRFIDGWSGAYWSTAAADYGRGYHRVRQQALSMVDPANHAKYHAQVEAGVAVFFDSIFALWGPRGWCLGHYLDPQVRARWLEHNVYHALVTTDTYAWFYSEKVNWYGTQLFSLLTEGEVAIRSARAKLANAEPLGFSIETDLLRGMARIDETIRDAVEPRSASIGRLPDGAAAPSIDGVLEEAVWSDDHALEAFVKIAGSAYAVVADVPWTPVFGKAPRRLSNGIPAWNIPTVLRQLGREKPRHPTAAWATYDDEAFYVALRCADGRMDRLRSAGAGDDADLGSGDFVELFVGLTDRPHPHRQFAVNPANARWDGIDNDPAWDDGRWQSAARQSEDHWTVELAIPWSMLGGSPKPGQTRRANLCRQRTSTPELSSWSQVVTELCEARLLGSWTFE